MRAAQLAIPAAAFVAAALTAAAAPVALGAQGAGTATVFHACYVPMAGTVYRIREPGLLQECLTKGPAPHVQFSWTDGAGAVRSGDAASGDLGGAFPNPSVLKLLGRAIATTPPADGQVYAWNAEADQWVPTTPSSGASDHGALTGLADDDHPQYLKADGSRPVAGNLAVSGSLTVGSNLTVRSHLNVGTQTVGTLSVTGGLRADGSLSVSGGLRLAGSVNASNFAVIAPSGFQFFSSEDLSTGCVISAGNLRCTGTVAGASDVHLKDGFEPVDAEEVLTKLAALRIQRWRYKADDPAVRHVGPTAQDFRAAFGLGPNDRTISMVDADGINMLAIQALERRTRELQAENAELRERLARLEAAVGRVTQGPR